MRMETTMSDTNLTSDQMNDLTNLAQAIGALDKVIEGLPADFPGKPALQQIRAALFAAFSNLCPPPPSPVNDGPSMSAMPSPEEMQRRAAMEAELQRQKRELLGPGEQEHTHEGVGLSGEPAPFEPPVLEPVPMGPAVP
jgi:hypothetical protein